MASCFCRKARLLLVLLLFLLLVLLVLLLLLLLLLPLLPPLPLPLPLYLIPLDSYFYHHPEIINSLEKAINAQFTLLKPCNSS